MISLQHSFVTFVLFISLMLASCTTQATLLNQKGYDSIALGTEIAVVQNCYGSPYEIINLSNGDQDYVFIERISSGDGRTDQTNYILRVSHGRVMSKRSENLGQTFYLEWY